MSLLKSQGLKIDHEFGNQGISAYSLQDTYLQGYKVGQTKSGSYLTINYIYNNKTNKAGFSLIMITAAGDIDRTFADNGQFEYYTEHTEYPADFLILPDQSIVLAFSDNAGKIEMIILDKDGKLINRNILSPFPNHYLIPIRLIYKEGFIFIGGIYNSISLNKELMFIIKLNSESKFDDAFGEKGIYLSEKITGLNARFQDMVKWNDQIIVFAAGNDNLSDHVFLYRLNADGSGDLDFADGGILFIRSDNDFGTIKTDKKGNIFVVPFDYPQVIKIDPQGIPDPGFGMNGVAIDDYFIDIMNSSNFSILQDDNSNIIFGDVLTKEGTLSPAIIRYNDQGKRDREFGDEGIFSDNPYITGSYINGCYDQNNKLVIIGTYADSASGSQRSFLTRYKLQINDTKETTEPFGLNIFPNPVTANQLFLRTINPDSEQIDISYEICNIIGKVCQKGLFERVNTREWKIDLNSNISNGFYYLTVRKGVFSESIKLLIER